MKGYVAPLSYKLTRRKADMRSFFWKLAWRQSLHLWSHVPAASIHDFLVVNLEYSCQRWGHQSSKVFCSCMWIHGPCFRVSQQNRRGTASRGERDAAATVVVPIIIIHKALRQVRFSDRMLPPTVRLICGHYVCRIEWDPFLESLSLPPAHRRCTS